jgi:hypothetical protein
MRERHWSAYLRLLPGGDNDVSSAVAASGILYVLLFLITLGPSYYYARTMAPPGFDAILPLVGAGALPALVLAAWTGLRVQRTQPIAPDEVAASPSDDRTWRGDRIARVPKDAHVVSTGPRYFVVELADGSRRRLWYRAGQEERQLLRLARALANRTKQRQRKERRAASSAAVAGPSGPAAEAEPEPADAPQEPPLEADGELEVLVEEGSQALAGELLPDPLAVEECLRQRLEELGVVLTKSEPW